MADINDEAAPSVKLFAAILYRDLEWLEQGLERLQGRFGSLDFRGPARRFDFTDFYAPEMGSDLSRCLVGRFDGARAAGKNSSGSWNKPPAAIWWAP